MDTMKKTAEEIKKEHELRMMEHSLRKEKDRSRMFQSRADHWYDKYQKAENKLADIGQQAYNKGYATGIGVGLMVGCIATIIDAAFWKKLLK